MDEQWRETSASTGHVRMCSLRWQYHCRFVDTASCVQYLISHIQLCGTTAVTDAAMKQECNATMQEGRQAEEDEAATERETSSFAC